MTAFIDEARRLLRLVIALLTIEEAGEIASVAFDWASALLGQIES